jgi:hypothetical protein
MHLVTLAHNLFLQDSGTTVMWNNQQQMFQVEVASPKKETKMRGLKSYIAYKLTPSVSIIFLESLG